MVKAVSNESSESAQIVLGVLKSVEGGATSQRRIAAELGIALGLVNAYLKRCLNKGLIKVREAPARRYAYYLTPRGFAEKSRLTVEYLSLSFSFFRKAKADCADVFTTAKARNFQTLVLRGKSDLAEIAILSAVESGVSILAVVDRGANGALAGKPIVPNYDQVGTPFDAVVVTDLKSANESFDEAVRLFGPHRVLAPLLLGLSPSKQRDAVL
jgi:DNA-binding MarR family transcriptional regulator